MYRNVECPIIKTHHLTFGDDDTEIKFKELKGIGPGHHLYLLGRFPKTLNDPSLLIKYLSSMKLTKITFDLVQISSSTFAGHSINTKPLIREIANIPIVEFVGCEISSQFYQLFFILAQHKTVELIFRDCRVTSELKAVIINNLQHNHSIRSLVICNTSNINIEDYKRITYEESKIDDILFRNRANYLCKIVAFTLILIRRRYNKYFNLVDKSIVIFIAKLVRNTKRDPKWLKVITDSVLNGVVSGM